MKQWATVEGSGNANVIVYVDTTAMAYALVSSLAVTGQFNEEDVQKMVRQLNTLLDDNEQRQQFFKAVNDQDRNDTSEEHKYVQTPNKYAVPVKTFYPRGYRKS